MNASSLALALALAAAPPAAEGGAAPAPAPPDSLRRAWSALALRRVRVTLSERGYVLREPVFGRAGIRWESVEGFPRRRPALIAGADWDSVPPPPNPVPWDALERLETPRPNRGSGAAIGAAAGFVVVGLPAIGLGAALEEYDPGDSDGSFLVVGLGVAIGATLVGASLGHLLIPPSHRWEPAPWPPAPPDSAARLVPAAAR